jgi:hypothetical protein
MLWNEEALGDIKTSRSGFELIVDLVAEYDDIAAVGFLLAAMSSRAYRIYLYVICTDFQTRLLESEYNKGFWMPVKQI